MGSGPRRFRFRFMAGQSRQARQGLKGRAAQLLSRLACDGRAWKRAFMPAANPADTLRSLLQRPGPDASEIRALLDGLTLADTITAVRALSGAKLQGALWRAVAANEPIRVADLVPADCPAMKPVVFHGKNSLPAFSHFLKICFRPRPPEFAKILWGYNETSIKNLIGPGYYVVRDTPGEPLGGAAFDYREVPRERLPSWPEIRPNDVGLSRFIYNGTVDFMRRVSRIVFIGSATRSGRELGNYFVLARELD